MTPNTYERNQQNMQTTLLQTLEAARAAAFAAANAVWERDEKQDRGSCGGAIMFLKGGRKLAKAAIAGGFARAGSDISINYDAYMPPGIRSQNADIPQAALRAFREVLIGAGFEADIKKFWTYTD